MKKRPLVLSIAGFDPTGGAGILADVKTFEQNKVLGMSVMTANTIQTEANFVSVDWIDEGIVLKQIELLLNNYSFAAVKIGLIPSLSFLLKITALPQLHQTKIIWDPILSASSGFDFKHDLALLEEVLEKVHLITPNWNEVQVLAKTSDATDGAKKLSTFTNVFLKGGHSDDLGKDYLFTKKGKVYPFNKMSNIATEKHGSGCILSSSLTAHIALKFPIIKACLRSKKYTSMVLESNKGLLGYHKR